MYFTLFNAVTKAIEELQNMHFEKGLFLLIEAQQAAEEIYIDEEEEGEA